MAITILDPLLDDAGADDIVRIWHDYGAYGQYSNEGFPTDFAPDLAQRYDAAINFVRTGGRFARASEGVAMLAARTNYFRETYAYGDDVFAPGIESFRDSEALVEAARALHGRPVIVPSIVYANILLPGQELAVHTDVPEFRGANRKVVPQWLLVVMHHSGLFDEWRMPITTAVSYFGHAKGGALAYYPDGAAGDPEVYEPRHNTAAVLDTDSVFHGVDRVEGDESALASLTVGMRIAHLGDERWELRRPDGEVVARFVTDDLRYSLSWKAYCFADDAERDAWERHVDDLALDQILAALETDMRARGRLDGDRPEDTDFGRLLIEEYVRFPAPQPVGEAG